MEERRMTKLGARLSRRHFLSYGAAGIGLAAAGLPLRAAELVPLTTGFGWIGNVEHAAFWRALDAGDFAAEGIDAKFLAGGPGLPNPLVSLSAGKIDVAWSDWVSVAGAVAKGNDFVIIGSNYPVSPSAFISLPTHPVREPKDLVGTRVLLQNQSNKAIVDAILSSAGLPLDYEMVPTGFSPEPLLNGDGDAFLAFATNQPITLEQMGKTAGKDFFVTLLDDLGYRIPTSTITVPRSLIDTKRDLVVGYLRALAKGYQRNKEDPTVAAKLVVEKYGADYGLDLAQQTRQSELQAPLQTYKGAPGPLLFDLDAIRSSLEKATAGAGIPTPDISKVIDLSLAKEALGAA
jgi:ABC-type nitrate/sulfonate/bicarbonate transport system substrate-binding protein